MTESTDQIVKQIAKEEEDGDIGFGIIIIVAFLTWMVWSSYSCVRDDIFRWKDCNKVEAKQ